MVASHETRYMGIKPLGWLGTFVWYGCAGLLLYIATRWGVPTAEKRLGVEPVVAWFISGGCLVFAPLLAAGWWALLKERWPAWISRELWRDRLRFHKPSAVDWLWCLAALMFVGAAGAGSLGFMKVVWGQASLHPPFLTMKPLTPDRYWIFAAWMPFWIVNIMGEEILWHGVLLPRQEAAFGQRAWLASGLGWLLFHMPFGFQIMFVLWPLTFVIPWLVQRRQNTWLGVILHAAINGPGFVAVAFGAA